MTPDPRFLYLSAAHREALAALVYGVSQRKGFISIIGEVGTGKTIILRAFLEGIDKKKTTAISLLNPLASFEQILDEILPADFVGSSPDRFRTLQEWLIEEYRQDRNVVVAIDEAQCMAPATLERLRLLSNLETADHKLIQIVFAGQPELASKLGQPKLRQLRDRIAVQARICPLDHADSVAYVKHRLAKVCSADSETVFSRFAINYLARRAKGNPRRLNILCDAALLAGFSYQRRPITFAIAWEAATRPSGNSKWRQLMLARAASIAVPLLIAAGTVLLWPGSDSAPTAENPLPAETSLATPVTDTGLSQSPGIAATEEIAAIDMTAARSQVPSAHELESAALSQLIVDPAGSDLPVSAVPSAIGTPDFGSTREVVVVGRGDGLWQLCREIYGNADIDTVRFVLTANPHIQDPNELTVGEEIRFPPLVIAGNPAATRTSNIFLED